MKKSLLTITLFSILAILPAGLLAQGSNSTKSDDADKLLQQMSKEFTAEDYDAVIETTTKLLTRTLTSKNRNTAFYVRGRSLFVTNFDNGKHRVDQSQSFKLTEAGAKNLKLAISDFGKVISYFRQNPPTESGQAGLQNLAYFSTASAYLNLGEYFSHQTAEFVKAEEFFKLALPKHEDQYFVNVQIVHCLAGQYKFYEAREVANRVLAAVPEVYYERRLRDAVEAFDMMGEYHFADALLLEQAGIRKAAGKTLQPITSVHNSKRATYKSFVEFSNPTTAMELNRKGVLLALSQQCEKALPLFEKSAAIVDNPTTARFAMACLAEQKQY